MRKKNFITFLAKAVFLVVFLFIGINFFSFLFKKRTSGDITWETFYNQEKESIDMLFYGNSHLGNGLDLNIINAKTGAKTYNVYSSGQVLAQTYYNIKESLEYQKPKLIIIETFSISGSKILFLEKNSIDVDSVPFYSKIQSFDPKRFGYIKFLEFKDLYDDKDMLTTFFPLIRNHYNWTNLEEVKENIIKRNSISNSKYYFGSSNSIWNMSSKSAEEYKNMKIDNLEFKLSKSEYEYFDKIANLANENDIKVLVLTIPIFKIYRDKMNYSKKQSIIKDLSLHYGFDYLDLNEVFPDLQYHYFANDKLGHNQHLNYKGAISVSDYLSSFIMDKYNFTFQNYNRSLPEYIIYNNLINGSLENEKDLIGNMEKFNGKPFKTTEIINQTNSFINLYGWMAIEGQEASKNEMFIGLVNEGQKFNYITKPDQLKKVLRKDVSKYFKKEKIYDKSGFKFTIKSEQLKKGLYKLYFIVRDGDGLLYFEQTHKQIQIK